MSNINSKAPDFTLKNSRKEDVSLSDYKGNPVVLAFYPGAFTGVCDTEMCKIKEDMSTFKELDTTVLGISVDSPWANSAFADKYDLTFELLSDLDRSTIKKYDLLFRVIKNCFGKGSIIYKKNVKEFFVIICKNQTCSDKLKDYTEIKNHLNNL